MNSCPGTNPVIRRDEWLTKKTKHLTFGYIIRTKIRLQKYQTSSNLMEFITGRAYHPLIIGSTIHFPSIGTEEEHFGNSVTLDKE